MIRKFSDYFKDTVGQKIQKSSGKKTPEIKIFSCIFSSFKLLPSSKIDFWPFLKLQKMEFGQKNFGKIDLLDFTSLTWTF